MLLLILYVSSFQYFQLSVSFLVVLLLILSLTGSSLLSLEKEMEAHSSTLAWKIPWAEEPCRLQSMGSQRVGHD